MPGCCPQWWSKAERGQGRPGRVGELVEVEADSQGGLPGLAFEEASALGAHVAWVPVSHEALQ